MLPYLTLLTSPYLTYLTSPYLILPYSSYLMYLTVVSNSPYLPCFTSPLLTSSCRTLMCRLLRTVYVVNDFVFSSHPTGNAFAMVCGLSESHHPLRHLNGIHDIAIENDTGKVFNRHTKLIYSGCLTGIDLRTQLWQFLRSELLTLKIDFNTIAGIYLFFSLIQFFYLRIYLIFSSS